MGRNLEGEEYLYGSSDRPKSPQVKLRIPGEERRHSLERRLERINIKLFNEDNSGNVERTNKEILKLVEELKLNPVVRDFGLEKYRVVSKGEGGVINISYHSTIPYRLENIFDNETVTYKTAAEYLRVDLEVIKKMVSEGNIKSYNNRVFLNNVNRIKTQKDSIQEDAI